MNDLILFLQKTIQDEILTPEKKREIQKLISLYPVYKVENILTYIYQKFDFNFKEPLISGIKFAIIGSIYASLDKNIDLLEPNQEIFINSIIEDICKNYESIKNKIYNETLWKIGSFDYGIKKVYYLDWQIFSSENIF